MVNFVYLIGDRETGEAVIVDPAYDVDELLDDPRGRRHAVRRRPRHPLPPRPRGRRHDGMDGRGHHPPARGGPGAHPRPGRRGALGDPHHRGRGRRAGHPPRRRRRPWSAPCPSPWSTPRATPRAASASWSTAVWSPATRSSSRAAAAPTCPAATPRRCTSRSPPAWPGARRHRALPRPPLLAGAVGHHGRHPGAQLRLPAPHPRAVDDHVRALSRSAGPVGPSLTRSTRPVTGQTYDDGR